MTLGGAKHCGSFLLLLSVLATAGGCRSARVNVILVNRGPALSLLELDYPSASFGMDSLAAGGQYHYQIQIQGSGPVTLQFQDGSGKTHTAHGPALTSGENGSLRAIIDAQNHVAWELRLQTSK